MCQGDGRVREITHRTDSSLLSSPATLVAELLAAEVDLAVQKINKSGTLLLPEVTLYEGCINKYLCSVGQKLLCVQGTGVLESIKKNPFSLEACLRRGGAHC